jgi:hypothetical protein
MYLLQPSTAPRTATKWGLGRFAGASSTGQPWRMRGLGRMGLQPVRLPQLGRLGQPPVSSPNGCVYYGADGVTVESIDPNSNVTECNVNGGQWYGTPALNTPSLPGAQNPSPSTGGASNGGITTVMAAKPSTSPLDYTSPQAAIAAGLDPQTVYNAWSAALARFPSPQAAISAGVPAGVVNQLWQSAYVNKAAAPAPSIGIGTIVLVGGGLFLLSALGGRRGMR